MALMLSVFVMAFTLFGADALPGKVIAVHDGDTVTVRQKTGDTFRLRLYVADAPEVGKCAQEHGEESRMALATMVLGRDIAYTKRATSWDRIVASITRRDLQSASIAEVAGGDISAWMIRNGHAWVDPRYDRRGEYVVYETAAKARKLGLWAGRAPVAPWEWRKKCR